MNWLRQFLPDRIAASRAERMRATLGILIGIAATGIVCLVCPGPVATGATLIAPIGASAVLLFGFPASPLAQPWAAIGGNVTAAIVGVTMARFVPQPLLAAALSVALTFAAMALLRCIHPPGGSVALTAVLGGSHVSAMGYGFVLMPVALNTLSLVIMAVIYNNLTRRSYPHRAHAPAHPHPPVVALSLAPEDMDEVLADYGEALDIGRDDLEALFQELLGRAQQRMLAGEKAGG